MLVLYSYSLRYSVNLRYSLCLSCLALVLLQLVGVYLILAMLEMLVIKQLCI